MSSLRRKQGFLVVISGPSGAGKNTVVNELGKRLDRIRYSVSATTRPPGPGEVDGVHYDFVTHDEFQEMREAGKLLEWATVYGNFYGTPRRFIEETTAEGYDVILDIDIQGARQVKSRWPAGIFVYLMPPSMEELWRRICARGRDSKDVIDSRFNLAWDELEAVFDYDYVVVNSNLDEAVDNLRAIITAERSKVARCDLVGFIKNLKTDRRCNSSK
jgi:guanylate kinase